MSRKILYSLNLVLIASFSALAAETASLPFVSPIFGDHMMLQRGKTNTIWGWLKPGDEIRVELADRTATATAGADGSVPGIGHARKPRH